MLPRCGGIWMLLSVSCHLAGGEWCVPHLQLSQTCAQSITDNQILPSQIQLQHTANSSNVQFCLAQRALSINQSLYTLCPYSPSGVSPTSGPTGVSSLQKHRLLKTIWSILPFSGACVSADLTPCWLCHCWNPNGLQGPKVTCYNIWWAKHKHAKPTECSTSLQAHSVRQWWIHGSHAYG